MGSSIIRFVILRLVRIFYPRIEVQGLEHLPAGGARIFVSNHPNGLIDPLIVMAALDERIAFLAKSTFFTNPVGRLLMAAFGALPVYRQRDEGKEGGAQGDGVQRNEQTFAQCRATLRRGEAMALFPEGTTHSGTMLLPLRTGASRIALSYEAEQGWTTELRVVPLGLWYQAKTQFRSSVLLVVGTPFTLASYAASYQHDERATVQALTHRIDGELDRVVLQAENAELLTGIPLVAAWTLPGDEPTLRDRHGRAAALLRAYELLQHHDPARLQRIAQHARRYARTLRTFGIDEPWDFELAEAKRGRLAWLLALLIVGLPIAVLGFALSYGPYRLARPLAPYAVGRFDEVTSTGKLIVGTVLVLLGWVIAALLVGMLFGWLWGLLILAIAPLSGYVALRWGESWRELREVATYNWLRLRHRDLGDAMIARRKALTVEVLEAARTVGVLDADGRVIPEMHVETAAQWAAVKGKGGE